MANERMYLVNKISGRRFCIAKHFGIAGWEIGVSEESLQNYFDQDQKAFYEDAHSWILEYD